MVLGALNITNMEEPGRVQLVSDFHFVHPNFTVGETSDDIAVIHLPRAVNPSRENFKNSFGFGLHKFIYFSLHHPC